MNYFLIDIFEPSKGTGFIDIQDGDAISESSDTEIVAHTKEQVQYGNQATSSERNSDSDENDGPPPLNSDEDDDDGSDIDGIDGPPPLDSDENAENTDGAEELPMSPNTGSSDELSTKRAPVQSERKGVKCSEDSESDSDNESGVKEAPPPLDSEDDEEENELSSPSAENVEGVYVDTVESYTHDSPVDEVTNDNDDNDNDDDHNDNDDEQRDDNNDNEDDEWHDDKIDDDDEQHNNNNDNDDDSIEEEEEEDTRAVAHTTESVSREIENSEESGQSDSPVEAEKQVSLQHQSDDSDDGMVNEKESLHRTAVDSVEEVHIASVVSEVSSSVTVDEDLHTDELDDKENAGVTEDTAISNELNEKEKAAASLDDDHNHDQVLRFSNEESPDDDSDQDSGDSPKFVPMEDENELEWDVEDFDLPPRKSAKTNSKTKTEGAEVDKLKKSFLDTLKSEAEQTKVVETGQKSESKKKEKADKGLNAKNTVKDEKKRADDYPKNTSDHDSKSEPGKHPKKITKDTSPKPEQVKTERKSLKDGGKNVPKVLASTKQVDSATKPVKAKVKATNKNVDKTDIKQKNEKQKRDIKETPRMTETSSVERKAVPKAGKVKSTSASSLHTGIHDQQRGANEQHRGQQTLLTKERKKPRPVSDLPVDSRSHIKYKEEVTVPAIQTKKELKKPRKSDSDATSDSSTRQKPQKTSSSESVTKQKKASPAVIPTHKENEKPVESTEVRKTKTKRTASKSVPVSTDHDDVIVNHERKRHSDAHVPVKNTTEVKAAKPRSRPTSNGHLSSSHEKLSSHSGRHDHAARDHASHKHSGHAHDRSKHVWLCRDDEIHKLIAQKASLLKEYESGSLAGRKVCK